MSPKKSAVNVDANQLNADQSQLIDGKYSIKDLVDLDRLREIFEGFSKATGFTTGLLSYPDLEVLVGTGWRDICQKYHRACPESEKYCKLSNQYLLGGLKNAGELGILPCENGLVDGATPVIVRGKHLASLTTGQVLFEKPDVERFKRQAQEFGFDEAEYLLALSKVPVVTPEQLNNVLSFLSGIAVEIAEQSLENLLAKETETALHESEEKYRSLVERANDGILIIQDGLVKYVNPHLAQMRGQSAEEIIGTRFEAYVHPDERPTISERYRRRLAGEDAPATYETVLLRSDNSKLYAELSAGMISYEGKPANLIVVRDVTERRQAENIQNAIYEIARSVISTTSLDDLYLAIHRALEKILPVDNFYIALYDPIQNLLSFPYFVDQYDAPSPTQTPGRGLTEYVLRTRKPLLATSQVFAQLLEQGEVETVGTDSVDWLGAPLNIGEKIIGVMVIQTYTDSVRLEQRDLDIMSFVSAQVAIAIERMRAEQATSQRTKELKALYDTSLDIISTHDLPTLLETIVERAVRLLDGSAGGLYLCDAMNREAHCVVSYNTSKDYRGTVLKYGEGAAGTVAETGKPLRIDDYRYWSKRAPIFDQEKPFTALISVPIICQGEVQGVLHVLDNVEDRHFEETHLDLLTQFANQAAIAIENANLYEKVQRYASELEDRVAERTAELSGRMAQVEELNRAMAGLLEDLQEANRRLEETGRKLQTANVELETFAYSVSHDLKAPLRGIDGYSHLLTEQYSDRLDEEGKSFIQNIRRATAHMGQLIDDLLTYSRLEQQKLTVRPVNARALVEDLLAERLKEIEGRKIQVTTEIPFKFITCDAEGLAQAMRNLVDNAIKFTGETPEAKIQIGGERTSGSTVLWVRDNGVGFDRKYHDRIFEIFQRLHTSDAYPGTGIGLSIVRKVMQRMGGRVWAESELGKGATFYLEFPIEKSHRRESNP